MYFHYTEFLKMVLDGDVDFAAADFRVRAVMTNTTCDTETDAATWGDFTTPDEFDGTGLTPHDIANLATQADTANDRAEVTADDGTFGSGVTGGTRALQALVYVLHVDGGDGDIPASYNDQGFPKTPQGGALDQEFDPEGIWQLQTAAQ